MTKEQEAIENLTDLLKQRNEKQVQITTYNLFENIETILSMLKENSAEIEQKNTELAEKNAEIEKLDKIIYEMIGSFIDLGFGFEYCNNDDRCINDCDKCIKQYFERKAKND